MGQSRFRIAEALGVGSVCMIYRCRIEGPGPAATGVFKIARDARTNELIANEAQVLRRLHAANGSDRFAPFVPQIEASFDYADDPLAPPRRVNVLRLHADISSADEIYTLSEVHAEYPAGIETKNVAWIWRRLLSVLSFAHANQVVHGAVLPMHVLIEPREHKLLLIDWCCAGIDPRRNPKWLSMISGGYRDWYDSGSSISDTEAQSIDIAAGARSMVQLLGGDPVRGTFPATVEPGIARHLERCLDGARTYPHADKLLDDFDRLIEALWGPRKFHVLTMPPKRRT